MKARLPPINGSTMRTGSRVHQRFGYGHIVSRRTIWRSLPLALTAAAVLQVMPAQAASMRTYVSGAGKDTGACSFSAPCRTLQTALKQTSPGGQIQSLDSADYGYVIINQSVTINGSHGVTGVLATSVSGITINGGAGDAVTLRGL